MTPEEFPALFTEGWRLPKPEGFLDYFLPMVHDHAVFSQPMFPDAHGRSEVERLFRRLFAMFQDFNVTPTRSAVNGEAVFIESDCTVTLGNTVVPFVVCDRMVIHDGQMIERRSFSDPSAILRAVPAHPTSWPRLVRGRFS